MSKAVKKKVNGRQKGATAERYLAKLFATWWGTEFARTPMSGGFSTAKFREDWNAAGDLVTPDPSFPFCVESKKVEGWTLEQLLTSKKTLIHSWWAQTIKETPGELIPLLVFTKNRAPLFACMCRNQMSANLNGCLEDHPKYAAFETAINGDVVVIFPLAALFETEKKDWL